MLCGCWPDKHTIVDANVLAYSIYMYVCDIYLLCIQKRIEQRGMNKKMHNLLMRTWAHTKYYREYGMASGNSSRRRRRRRRLLCNAHCVYTLSSSSWPHKCRQQLHIYTVQQHISHKVFLMRPLNCIMNELVFFCCILKLKKKENIILL